MQERRIYVSITLLLLSIFVFLGVISYLVWNTYKLEYQKFQFNSSKIVSDIYFSIPMGNYALKEFSELYYNTYKKSEDEHTDSPKKLDSLKIELKKYYDGFQTIEKKIQDSLKSQHINTQVKIAYSIVEIGSDDEDVFRNPYKANTLELDEIMLYGNDKIKATASSYNFYNWVEGYHLAFRLYVDYPQLWKFLLSKIKILLLGSIISLLVVFGIFLYNIRTILKQKKLAEIKNDFINNMTHELNTPLSTIRVAGQNLLKDKIKQEPKLVANLASTIIRQNLRLQKIVSAVLQTSISNNQSEKLKLKTQSLHKIISELIKDFSLNYQEHKIKIELKLNAPTDLVKIDIFYFASAINNILDNAVKYSTENTKQIQIETFNINDQIILDISDNGIGIPKNEQSEIFEKFYRISQGNIHTIKGLGLGLYLTKQIINAHHGRLKLRSTQGKGSTFSIILPL